MLRILCHLDLYADHYLRLNSGLTLTQEIRKQLGQIRKAFGEIDGFCMKATIRTGICDTIRYSDGGLSPMRFPILVALLTAALFCPALAKTTRPLVTLHCANSDLGGVLHKIAGQMGCNLYIGPGVTGTVTADLRGVPAEGALGLVLRMQSVDYRYKLVGNTLVVATPEKLAQIPDNLFRR